MIEQALAEKLAGLDQQRAAAHAEGGARIDRLPDRMAARLGPADGDDPTGFLHDATTGWPR